MFATIKTSSDLDTREIGYRQYVALHSLHSKMKKRLNPGVSIPFHEREQLRIHVSPTLLEVVRERTVVDSLLALRPTSINM
jgi:hypothetical protein